MNFTEEYSKRLNEFEGYLRQFASELVTYPEMLYNAVSYGLLSGGKRLRPLLLLEAVRMFGGVVDASAVNFALAIECIHTYSLIHDDLPCMDNDDFRRGQPTCHKKFGEATAVLAGDALLNLAYELIFSAIALRDRQENYVRAGIAIAAAAGGNGMVGGQACELAAENEQSIDYIYSHKTGALIRAALKAGALIANTSLENAEKIGKFGELFGYCFQLRDDLLDKGGEDEGKITYLQAHGEEGTAAALKSKTVEALEILATVENAEFLTELTANFMEREA